MQGDRHRERARRAPPPRVRPVDQGQRDQGEDRHPAVRGQHPGQPADPGQQQRQVHRRRQRQHGLPGEPARPGTQPLEHGVRGVVRAGHGRQVRHRERRVQQAGPQPFDDGRVQPGLAAHGYLPGRRREHGPQQTGQQDVGRGQPSGRRDVLVDAVGGRARGRRGRGVGRGGGGGRGEGHRTWVPCPGPSLPAATLPGEARERPERGPGGSSGEQGVAERPGRSVRGVGPTAAPRWRETGGGCRECR